MIYNCFIALEKQKWSLGVGPEVKNTYVLLLHSTQFVVLGMSGGS